MLPSTQLDILVMQEVWTPELRGKVIAAAAEAGFEHVFEPHPAPGGGLLVLSRIPFAEARFERYRFRGDLDRLTKGEYLGGKGFVSLVFETGAGRLRVVGTHLHARYRRDRPFLNSAVRTAQLLQLIEHVRGSAEATIVAGDLNCEDGDREYRVFTGLTGMRDAASWLGEAMPTICRSNHWKRGRSGEDMRIDYVFTRDGVEDGLVPRSAWRIFDEPVLYGGRMRPVSDHYGVACEVELKRGTGRVATPASPDPRAIELAHRLLADGRQEVSRDEASQIRSAGSWLLGAAALLVARQDQRVTRRDMLRRGLGALAVAAMAPAIGWTAVARIDAPAKLSAFDAATDLLDGIQRAPVVAATGVRDAHQPSDRDETS